MTRQCVILILLLFVANVDTEHARVRSFFVVAAAEEQQAPLGGVEERAVPEGKIAPIIPPASRLPMPPIIGSPSAGPKSGVGDLLAPVVGNAPPVTPNTFYVVSYGGRCLDFGPPPQVSGGPVFIYGCNGTIAQQVVVEEIKENPRHEVILRAGMKVIGVKHSMLPPQVMSRGTVPKGAGFGTLGETLSIAPDAPLELQEEISRQPEVPSPQIFALDGDSIVLASNRNRVVQVQNNRGANRTPLILGSRNLADAEFWTFVATDKSGRYPTNGFVRVPPIADPIKQTNAFVDAVNNAKWGTVIEVDPTVFIDLTDRVNPDRSINPSYLLIPEGVTIRSNRRGTNLGAMLFTDKVSSRKAMLQIAGNDVRITRLRLRGPNHERSTSGDLPESRGIVAADKYLRTIIDHNDIGDWTHQGVGVYAEVEESTGCDPTDQQDPRSRPHNVRVARNFIHHNLKQNGGYGVEAHANSFPLIEANMFYSNRHAIAGGIRGPHTGYRAWYNLVLSEAPAQKKVGIPLWHTHDFDMHGTGDNGFGGKGGDYIDVFRNTFLGTNRNNFKLRGSPCKYVEFHNNASLLNKDDAVVFDIGLTGAAIADLRVYDNLWKSNNPTTRLGVGDFDGDGTDDVFLATGVAWYYAPHGKAEWHFLNAQTDLIGSLLFGDFDGDGRTDVFTQHGFDWLVSWGGAFSWEKINVFSQVPMSEYAIGDFNGDHLADVFYADGKHWYVSYGGNSPFTLTADSGYRVPDLGFGDFNGDGKTDVVGVVSGKWMVSLSATGPWAGWPLRPALTKTMAGLIIADFNGNGRADIATYSVSTAGVGSDTTTFYDWKVSYDGTGNWTPLRTLNSPPAAIGRFDAAPGADLLFYWTNDNYLGIQSSLGAAPVRHSTQHMR